MLEFEKKVMLTEKECSTLLNAVGGRKSIHQTNYYYDTDNLSMTRSGATFRVRKKGAVIEATRKFHHMDKKDCSLENTVILKGVPDVFPGTQTVLKKLGSLTTDRVIIGGAHGTKVSLDINRYLGVTDYEFEIEYPMGEEDKAVGILIGYAGLLKACGALPDIDEFVSRQGKGKSKSERFFARYLYMKEKSKSRKID